MSNGYVPHVSSSLVLPNIAFEGAQEGYGAKLASAPGNPAGEDGNNFKDGTDVVIVNHTTYASDSETGKYLTNTLNVETHPIFRFDELCHALNADDASTDALPKLYRDNITKDTDGKFIYRPSSLPETRLPRIIERGTYKRSPPQLLEQPEGQEGPSQDDLLIMQRLLGSDDSIVRNAGRLGKLDDPDHCDRIWGTAGGQFMDIKSV